MRIEKKILYLVDSV